MNRTMISLVLICLISLSPISSVCIQAQENPAQEATQPAAERGWPRTYRTSSNASVVIYTPQIASWEGQKQLIGYAAVSYLPEGEQKPALGTLKLEARSEVALESRLVRFSTVKITEANFQSLPKERTQEIIIEVEKSIPVEERVIALDRVLSNIDKSQIIPKNVEGLKADPPVIFFSKTPTVLVNIDGDPIWSPIKDNDLKFAVNTNWDLFTHGPTASYYLRKEATWLRATDLKGPWVPAGTMPESFKKLPDDENWKEVKANLPGKPATEVPKVFVSTKPSELIQLEGEPFYYLVPGTNLQWISNTDSDLFRMKDGAFYYLVAGRWFSAPELTGAWTFASTNLPEDFKKISLEHPRSRVLASVPGTQQAAEAVLLAQVPQTARVNKNELKGPDVVYQGDPSYEPIEGTSLHRAVNTDKDIIKVGELYYLCYQGVWFMGRDPNGPWEVATSVPAEIDQIPASSPSHHVSYVDIEEDDDDDDEWVTYAAYGGYSGMMVGWGCAVWGTGWYYPPYYWYGGYYPIYYPYWRTYGYAAWYNPYTGVYGTAGRIYGPYGGVGFGARYNPSTGTYARGAFAYGPYGARGAAQAYNPRTGAYAATRQGSGVYGSWGSTHVQRGDDWASTKRFTNRATGNTTRVTRTDDGAMVRRKGSDGSGFVGTKGDNVYAGRDGNAYRRDENGNWSKWENGSWNDAGRPDDATPKQRDKSGDRAGRDRGDKMDSSTYKGLERDRSARSEGSTRTRDYSSYKSKGSGNAGSYRGGGSSRGGGGFSRGGGFRGGGGRR